MSALPPATDTADLMPKTRHFFKTRQSKNHTLDHTLATGFACCRCGQGGAKNPKADIQLIPCDVCFSNRPIGVKRFQAIHHCGLDVARGLVLLSGLGAGALPSWDPRTRWNNLLGGLSVKRTVGPSRHANSPHPSSREGHYSTAWWSSSFLLSHLILSGS